MFEVTGYDDVCIDALVAAANHARHASQLSKVQSARWLRWKVLFNIKSASNQGDNTMIVDHLSCQNCVCPITNGDPCNHTCRGKLLETQSRAWLTRHNVVSACHDVHRHVERFVADLDEANRKANILQVLDKPNWV
jgi:hypothetical protein